MMTDVEMTDAEVADQIERADRFIANFREMIAATVVDPASPCADYQRRGLRRIADDAGRGAVRDDVQSGEPRRGVARRAAGPDRGAADRVGGGPTLDFADAAEFLAGFEPMIEKVRRRRLQ